MSESPVCDHVLWVHEAGRETAGAAPSISPPPRRTGYVERAGNRLAKRRPLPSEDGSACHGGLIRSVITPEKAKAQGRDARQGSPLSCVPRQRPPAFCQDSTVSPHSTATGDPDPAKGCFHPPGYDAEGRWLLPCHLVEVWEQDLARAVWNSDYCERYPGIGTRDIPGLAVCVR